jgi:hypothetical protein
MVLAVLFGGVHESEAATEVCEMMLCWPLQLVVSGTQQPMKAFCISRTNHGQILHITA